LDGFDVDIIRIPVTIELHLFKLTSDRVRFSLAFDPPRASQHPEIDIASSVSLSSRNTPIQDNADNVANVLAKFRDRSFDRVMILRLGNPEDRIVWDRKALSVDLDESLVAFG
jgi:hypothetical protein